MVPLWQDLTAGGKPAMAAALAALESRSGDDALISLLDKAYHVPRAQVIGMTGPPGVGKSSLTGALVAAWRAQGHSVGVIAVDPSSRRSGGALLGDRTRIVTDPSDEHVFIRSMAARDRLGGVSDITYGAAILMRAVYDRVVIETVGVGQSETEIADLADTVLICVQPGSGDSLQFMKAGIMEVPDIAVVTKADMGAAADRAKADVTGALGLAAESGGWAVPVLKVSVQQTSGIDDLVEGIASHWAWLESTGTCEARREAQARAFIRRSILERFGREGLKKVGELPEATARISPFEIVRSLSNKLLDC